MQRIQQFATTVAGACGLLLLGCQPNTTQSEPPPDEGSMPGQTQPMDADDAMPEESYPEEDMTSPDESPPGGEMGEQPQDQQISQSGQQFIQEATLSGMAEVELSRAAMEKTKDQKIRQLAQRIIEDHTTMGNELKTLATQMGATVPTEMPESVKQRKEELQKLSGKKLDEKYVDMMVDDHEKAVDLFREQSENDEDPKLQTFASTNLPTLQEHLDHAKAIDEGKPIPGPQARGPKAKPGKIVAKP